MAAVSSVVLLSNVGNTKVVRKVKSVLPYKDIY